MRKVMFDCVYLTCRPPSASQIYRLAAEKPKRLNLQVLVALMDTLDCTADGLIGKVTCLRRRALPRGLTEELRRRGAEHRPGWGVRQQPRNPLPVPQVRELTHVAVYRQCVP